MLHDLDRDPRYQLAKRVAQSQHFQKAPRLREFLLFVCEQTLLGQAENLTEQKLGQRIFERHADYSPADDSIVRVQARQLRLRLAEYFQGEGRDEKCTIEIPKGSYAAVFHDHRAAPDPGPVVAVAARPVRRALGMVLAGGLLVALGITSIVLYVDNRQLRASAGGRLSPAGPKPWLLAAVFEDAQNTNVVIGDPVFGNIQGMLNQELSLEEYLRPGYPQSILPPQLAPEYVHAFRTFSGYNISGFTQVLMAERLGKLGEKYGWQYTLRHSRDLTMRDVARGNQVLFGSKMSTPWVGLYEKNLELQSGWDSEHKVVYFRDTAPPDGAPRVYASAGPNGIPGSAFAVIALLTGPPPSSENSRVLMFRGTKGEAVEAAWELAANPNRMQERLTSAGFDVAAIKKSPHFEILIETKALAGSPGEVVVRSVRLHR
jgi:hypothetical protein